MIKMNKLNKIGVVILIFIMALIGCKDESISKYSVPKRPAGAEETATHAHHAKEAIKSSGISQPNAVSLAWQLPSGWQEKQPGRMALASFDVVVGDATAECVVSKFPGDVGGLVANINRWRGQIGLASLDDAAAIASAETFTTSFGKIYYLKLDNASAQKAMLTAILPGDNFVVFVKMMPPSNLVAQLEASFVSFTKSITLK
jgi:hypothetical protein